MIDRDKRNNIIEQLISEGYGATDLSKIMPIFDEFVEEMEELEND